MLLTIVNNYGSNKVCRKVQKKLQNGYLMLYI